MIGTTSLVMSVATVRFTWIWNGQTCAFPQTLSVLCYSLVDPWKKLVFTFRTLTGSQVCWSIETVDCYRREVFCLRDLHNPNRSHSPHGELITEWRALTISLLDELAIQIDFNWKPDLALDKFYKEAPGPLGVNLLINFVRMEAPRYVLRVMELYFERKHDENVHVIKHHWSTQLTLLRMKETGKVNSVPSCAK